MHRLLIALICVLVSTAALAKTDLAGELATLRDFVESQNRLLTEQSAQLRGLTERVATLEGRPINIAPSSSSIVGLEIEPVRPQERPRSKNRTTAIDSSEIGLQYKQSLRTGREAVIVEDAVVLSDSMDIYGSMRIFAEAGAEDPTLNDGLSRVGLRVGREFGDGKSLFGRIEWKANLVDNDSELVVGDRTSSGGITLREESTESVLSTRLGYLGMRLDNIGELTFGKQWSVYYDVAGWTDSFNVYGRTGLSAFAAGTDGGAVGSGRADNAIIWRNERGKVSYGLQTQLKTSADDNDYTGLGGSVIFKPNDRWDIGFAFAGSQIEGTFEDLTGDDSSGVATIGARYQNGPWNTAINVAKWKNHEAIFFEDDTLIYDGVGAEMYTSYEFSDRWHVYGGFNYTDPDIDDPRVDPGFGTETLIFGASLFATDESFFYLEGLLSSGRDSDGKHVDSVISAGFRFDY